MAGDTINIMQGGSYMDIHHNNEVNINIGKSTVQVPVKQQETFHDIAAKESRQQIIDELFSLVDNGPWVNGITPDDIKTMLTKVLGMGGTSLNDEQAALSEILWHMLEHGRGGDRVRITWQNIAGYLWDKKLLNASSAPQLNHEFFGDKENYGNINKGRYERLSEVSPLLDAYLPKIDKKR